MKLMKATLMRLWHLTRATSIAVSLAVVVALVGGVVSGAVAATPTTTTATAILKGVSNTATAVTTLVNSGNGEALRLEAKAGNPALNLPAPTGTAPLRVNSETVVDHLNADKVDGKDATAFVSATANGKAPDSELLDGIDSAKFAQLTPDGKVPNADQLDGMDSTKFAQLTPDGKVANADQLDGKDSTDFMTASHLYIQSTVSGQGPDAVGFTGAAHERGFEQAMCDSTPVSGVQDIALSGGWSEPKLTVPLPEDFTIIRDRPMDYIDPQAGEHLLFGWNVMWINGSTPRDIEVWALCLDRGAPHQE